MCGIVGILNIDDSPVSYKVLRKMTNALSHRGPDGEGYYHNGSIGLGHKRLAITDLTNAGSQPMKSDDGRYVIAFNGEIYNFQEIKSKLKGNGQVFCSSSDTEVALKSISEWGISSIETWNGMFAFAFWDNEKRELYLARDRYGMKPLYISISNKSILFSSEIKAILQHPSIFAEVNKDVLVEYFTFQNVITKNTLFKNIDLIPAGYFIKVQIRSGSVSKHQYWDYNFTEQKEYSHIGICKEKLDSLFNKTIAEIIPNNIDFGAYLSGGIDTSTVVAYASRKQAGLNTFSCSFNFAAANSWENKYDEKDKALSVSKVFKTCHHDTIINANDIKRVLRNLIKSQEELRLGASYPNFIAASFASKFVKVILSGGGGDELFGGYPWRYPYQSAATFSGFLESYYKKKAILFDETLHASVFKPIWGEVKHIDTREIFSKVFNHSSRKGLSNRDFVNFSLYYEAKTFLQSLLLIEDKINMGFGMETRFPFLDNNIVDFALQLPLEFKLSKQNELKGTITHSSQEISYNRTRNGKIILRHLLSDYLPEQIAFQEKQGFCGPDASWFKEELKEFLFITILNKNAKVYNYLDWATVQPMILRHFEGRQNQYRLIWSLICFEQWLEIFVY